MDMVVYILKIYLVIFTMIVFVYMLRHFIFTFNRLFGDQKMYYQDILDNDVPYVSVIIPMHNEEKVARQILDRLLKSDYSKEKLEIIPVNDHSTDKTKNILEEYAAKSPLIKPYHREGDSDRGKVFVLNEAMDLSKGEIIVVFDADYQPPTGIIRELVIGFKDPEIGAVMGRVLVSNCTSNLLTMMLEMERSGGYQVDQQARYNLNLIPQYGGTVGAYRKDAVFNMGKFNPKVLAEDTELTFKMFLNGWKVAYANRAECYEEATESWEARAKQIKRWARGHNEVMFRYFGSLFTSKYLSLREKIDGLLLIFIYMLPALLLVGIVSSIILFFLGELEIFSGLLFFIFVIALSSFGNFAPFFQIGVGNFIDGRTHALRLIPMFAFNYVFYMIYISLGFWESLLDFFRQKNPQWDKTERYKKEEEHV